jgi:DNA-binding MarR family transcriptional regulator
MESRIESIGALLSNVTRLMRRAFEQRLQTCSLTQAQARALVKISRHEGIRQVSLSELLEVQPITLVHLLDQLVDAKLVERRPDPTDRRAYQLYLTAAAAPQLAEIETVIEAIREDALRGLSEHEIEAVMTALHKMHANLNLSAR